jgi:hypothetical protein
VQDESVSYLRLACFETKHLLSLFPYIYNPVGVSDETVKGRWDNKKRTCPTFPLEMFCHREKGVRCVHKAH